MAIDDACKLFVAGLPDSITEAVLRQLFEAAGGKVVEISLPRDRATGRPRGFGFVTLSSEDEARLTRQSLDGSMQSGRSISVRPFQGGPGRGREGGRSESGPSPMREGGPSPAAGAGGGRGDDRTVYLGNLPYDSSPSEVEQLLSNAGIEKIVRVNLPQDAQGRPRGFGFVTFTTPESAEAAVTLLRDVELKGRRVSASMAYGRGDRPPRPSYPSARGNEPPPPRSFDSGRRFREPYTSEPPEPPAFGGPPGEEGRGEGRRRKEPKKKKNKARTPAERGRTRRESEGLRAPRARDWLDDDED